MNKINETNAPAVDSGAPVAYVYEHATHPGDYTRLVSFEQTDHSKDFVRRPLFYGAQIPGVFREALEHIIEYWNRDRNEDAMYDALEHMIETAAQALESVPSAAGGPIYQADESAGRVWRDISLESFEGTPEDQRRIVYTAPCAASDADPTTVYDPAYVRQKFSDYQSQIDGLKEELAFVLKKSSAAGEPRLDRPAKVGAIRFRAGVKWSTVIDAAQRLFECEVTPDKESDRIAKAHATMGYIRTGDLRPVIDEDGLIGAAIDGDALIEATFKQTVPFTYKSFGRALLAAAWTDKPKAPTTATRIPGELSARQAMETAVAHAFGGKPIDPCDCIACVKMRGHQYGEC